jgi:hypothetical protein
VLLPPSTRAYSVSAEYLRFPLTGINLYTDNMSGQGKILVAVTASFLALAILTVWLRCYTRIFLQPSFGLDDGLAIASLVMTLLILIPF